MTPDYDAVLAGMTVDKKPEGQAARFGFAASVDTNPDAQAEAARIARRTGVPIDTVLAQPVEMKRQAAVGSINFDALARTSPATASLLADVEKAKLTHDNVSSLSSIESMVGKAARFVMGADQGGGLPGFLGRNVDALRAGGNVLNEGAWGGVRALAENVPGMGGAPMVERATRYGQAARGQAARLMPQTDNVLEAGWYSGVQSLGSNVITLPLGIAGGMAPLLTAMGVTTGGKAYAEARDKGVSLPQSLAFGTSQGLIEAGTEMIGMPALLSMLKPGKFGAKALEYMIKEQGGEQIATHLQDLNEWAVLHPEKTFADYLSERPNAALQTAIATAVGGGGQVAVMRGVQAIAKATGRVQQADADVNMLTELGKVVQADKLLQRDAQTFETFVTAAAEDGPVSHVYIDAQVLMQSGLAEQVAQVSPAVAAQFAEAVATGGQIEVPVAEYAARIAPAEFAAQLLPHLKTQVDGFSQTEAKAWMAEEAEGGKLKAAFDAMAAKVEAVDAAKADRDAVKAQFIQELAAVQRFTPEANERYASLLANYYAAQAQRLGVSAVELLDRYKLRVQSQAAPGANVMDQAAYHGTPHRGIEKFSTDKIGTGEGAQAYGYGLYFAGKREVAEFYREKLSGSADQAPRRFFKGQELQPGTGEYHAARLVDGATLSKARKDVAGWIADSTTWDERRKSDAGEQAMLASWKRTLEVLNEAGSKRDFSKKPAQGQLYEVEVPDDSEMLDWDKPLSEQPKAVRVALKSLLLSDKVEARALEDFEVKNRKALAAKLLLPDAEGKDLYGSLTDVFRTDKAASEALLAAGVKGIKYLDGTSRSDGEGTHNYVVFSGDDVAIKGTFYQGPRAQIAFPADLTAEQSIITLFKGADLSSFLHESGHFFLQAQADMASRIEGLQRDGVEITEGEQQILADTRAVLTWFGLKDTPEASALAQWFGMTPDQQREHHEKFARGFEAYLFEGKAPSIELHGLFQRVRAWMVSIYKDLKGLNVDLDDTVRRVFDRLLATDEQIAMAEAARGMAPMFETAEAAGWTEAEFAAYQALAGDAPKEAAEELQAKALRDLRWLRGARGRALKSLQKEAAALRSEVKIEARREVMSQPVYRAWQFLTRKVRAEDKPGAPPKAGPSSDAQVDPQIDSLLVAIAKLGGLRRDAATSDLGVHADDYKTQSGVFGKPVFRKEGGKTAGNMAENLVELGYLQTDESGKRSLHDLESLISEELHGNPQYSLSFDYNRLNARPGDQLLNPQALEAGRLDEGELLVMGLPVEVVNALKSRRMVAANGLHPDIVAELHQFGSGDEMVRALAAAQPPAEAIEALTDERMLEQHGELATPQAIESAADAAVHSELRGRVLATEANAMAKATGQGKVLMSAAREYAAGMISRLKVRDIQPARYANAAERAGREAVRAQRKGDLPMAASQKRSQLLQTTAARAATLARDEMESLRRKWAEFANSSDDKLKKTYDLDMVNAVRAIVAGVGIAEGRGKRAAEYLEKLQAYDPVTFEVVNASVLAAEAISKPLKEMTVGEVRALGEEIDAIIHLARNSRSMEVGGDRIDREEVAEALKGRMAELGVPDSPGMASAITPAEQRMAKFKTFIAAARRVESWVGAMDGGDQVGAFRRFIFGPIKDAADRYRTDKTKYLHKFRDLVAAVAPTLKPRVIFANELDYTFGNDTGGAAVNEILHAILHTGNASNKRKLLLGRKWATEENGILDTSRWDAFIARMAREGVLTKEHFDFAQGVWDLLEEMKPKAQETHRDVFGKYFDEVTAEPLVTPFGTYAGGYVPAMVDSRIVTEAKLRKLQDEENAGMAYAFPSTPNGFTKARVEYNRPLMLDLRTLAQHMDQVLLFSHMTGPVRDVQKVLKDIGGDLDKIDPGALDGMLAPWLNRSARQQVTTPITADAGASRFFTTMRSRAGMAAMFGNVVNAAQQITSFGVAALKVKPRLLLSAAADFAKNPREFARAVAEASPAMASRLENEVAAMGDQINEIMLNPNLLQQGERWTMRHAYFLQSAVDSCMSPIVWKGAYDQAMEGGATHEDAVRLGDSAVRETQGSSLPEDVSRMETGNAFVRLFTQFAGYFNMQANVLGTEFVKVGRDIGLRNGAGRGLFVLFFGFMAPAIVAEAIVQIARGGPGDDDDDGYLDDWLAALFVWAPLRNATAMVPGVGQGINAVANSGNGKPYDDRIATSPAISMLEAAARAPFSAYRAMVEDGSAQKAVRDVATLISMSVGLPANLAARPIGYLSGVADGRIEPAGPTDTVRGLVTGSPGKQ
jgi:hypothetical protein